LILGLAVWASLCNPHEPPSDAKSELHGSGFQTVDTFEDAKIDISP